jgi:hypothetical protein
MIPFLCQRIGTKARYEGGLRRTKKVKEGWQEESRNKKIKKGSTHIEAEF